MDAFQQMIESQRAGQAPAATETAPPSTEDQLAAAQARIAELEGQAPAPDAEHAEPVPPEETAPVDPHADSPAVGAAVAFYSDYGVQRGWVHAHELVNLEPNSKAEPSEPACVVMWADGELSGPIPAADLVTA